MSMRGNPSVNHHWCASSVLTLHDFDGDDHFDEFKPCFLRAFVVDESNQAWWGRILSVVLLRSPSSQIKPAVVTLRVTAPRCFTTAEMPRNGVLTVTLTHPPTSSYPSGFWKQIPVPVEYVDDNGL